MAGELRWALTVVAIWTAAGYIFGSPRIYSSPSLSVVRSLGVPFVVWGLIYLALAALLWISPAVSAWVGVWLHLFWSACIAATIPTGQIAGWPGPAWAFFLAVGHHVLYRLSEEREPVH